MSRQKRLFDLCFAIPGFLILSPFFYLAAVAIKLDSPGPVFFRQLRVGRQGHYFRLVKFRTMLAHAEKMGPQITVGKDSRIHATGGAAEKDEGGRVTTAFQCADRRYESGGAAAGSATLCLLVFPRR